MLENRSSPIFLPPKRQSPELLFFFLNISRIFPIFFGILKENRSFPIFKKREIAPQSTIKNRSAEKIDPFT